MSDALRRHIANIPDFPQAGVVFRDISPLLAHDFPSVVTAMTGLFTDAELKTIDAFAGVDSRGFIFASAMAAHTGKNFIMPRKAGKLPAPYAEKEYQLEYGTARLQLKHGTGNIIVIDDVLATGGTLAAAADLCADAGYTVKGFATLINLSFLNNFTWNGLNARSVITYDTP